MKLTAALLTLLVIASCEAPSAPAAEVVTPVAEGSAPAPEENPAAAAGAVAPAVRHLRNAVHHRRVRHRHAAPR